MCLPTAHATPRAGPPDRPKTRRGPRLGSARKRLGRGVTGAAGVGVHRSGIHQLTPRPRRPTDRSTRTRPGRYAAAVGVPRTCTDLTRAPSRPAIPQLCERLIQTVPPVPSWSRSHRIGANTTMLLLLLCTQLFPGTAPRLRWRAIHHAIGGAMPKDTRVITIRPESDALPRPFKRLAPCARNHLADRGLHGWNRRIIRHLIEAWTAETDELAEKLQTSKDVPLEWHGKLPSIT